MTKHDCGWPVDSVVGLVMAVCMGRQQQDVAAEWGISATYLSDVLNHRKEPGPAILKHLGLRREWRYFKATA